MMIERNTSLEDHPVNLKILCGSTTSSVLFRSRRLCIHHRLSQIVCLFGREINFIW